MIFVLKYWRYFAIGFAVLSLVSALLVYRAALIGQGYNKGIEECNTGKVDTINNRIEIKRGQDAIARTNSDNEYIDSLLKGEL